MALCCEFSYSQPFDYSVTSNFDQSNNIRQYLCKIASDITDNSLTDVNNLQEWEAIRDQRYQEFLEMMGLSDKPIRGERLPPKVTKTSLSGAR